MDCLWVGRLRHLYERESEDILRLRLVCARRQGMHTTVSDYLARLPHLSILGVVSPHIYVLYICVEHVRDHASRISELAKTSSYQSDGTN